jgi:D-Ala-D-Ala carboxypeptidase 3 (S13) family protein
MIYGRGDPSIAARFNNGDYFKGIDDLAERIKAAGVKRVEGDLVGDESYFSGPQYGSGWEWEDLTWWFGAEVSPLTANDNALDLSVKPGTEVGAPAVITTGPSDPLLSIVNHVITTAKGTKRELSVYCGLDTPGQQWLFRGHRYLEARSLVCLLAAGVIGAARNQRHRKNADDRHLTVRPDSPGSARQVCAELIKEPSYWSCSH